MSLPTSSLTYYSRDPVMEQQREIASKGRRKWIPEDDRKLCQYVNTYGARNWKTVARNLDLGKSASSCSQRWHNYLAPGLKHGKFTDDEKNQIRTLHSRYGNKWAKIARKLPGRTANAIKNFCNTHLAKEARLLKNADVESDDFSTVPEVGQDAGGSGVVSDEPSSAYESELGEYLLPEPFSSGRTAKEARLLNADVESETIPEVGQVAVPTAAATPPPRENGVVFGEAYSGYPHNQIVNHGGYADVSAVPFHGGDPSIYHHHQFDDFGFL